MTTVEIEMQMTDTISIFYFYFTDKIDVVSAIGISMSTLAVGFFGEKFQRKIK